MNKILAGLIFLAILPMPHDYYWILRSLVFMGCAYFFFHDRDRFNDVGKWSLVICAVIYNPFIPFYLGKPVWVVINIASGFFFVALDKFKSE